MPAMFPFLTKKRIPSGLQNSSNTSHAFSHQGFALLHPARFERTTYGLGRRKIPAISSYGISTYNEYIRTYGIVCTLAWVLILHCFYGHSDGKFDGKF